MDTDVEVAKRRLGQILGHKWRLDRLIGTGGMAAVYAATSADGRTGAVKLLHPEMSLKRDVRERFARESYVSNKVGHSGVVQILEDDASDERAAYIVMELLEGETLADRFRRVGPPSVPEALDYLAQILSVLAAAHAQSIIHRDLKPDNLFITHAGQVKVLDFGVARMLDDVSSGFQTRTGLALGTLPYMAPEQALGRRAQVDGRADLFALGATMFRMLSQRRVHEAESEAELLIAMASRPAPPLQSVAAHLPDDLCAVIDAALAFSRDARYPDARTMLEDVLALQRGQTPPFAARRRAFDVAAGTSVPPAADGTSDAEATRIDRAAAEPASRAVRAMGRTVPLAAMAPGVAQAAAARLKTAVMPVATMPQAAAAPSTWRVDAATAPPAETPSSTFAASIAQHTLAALQAAQIAPATGSAPLHDLPTQTTAVPTTAAAVTAQRPAPPSSNVGRIAIVAVLGLLLLGAAGAFALFRGITRAGTAAVPASATASRLSSAAPAYGSAAPASSARGVAPALFGHLTGPAPAGATGSTVASSAAPPATTPVASAPPAGTAPPAATTAAPPTTTTTTTAAPPTTTAPPKSTAPPAGTAPVPHNQPPSKKKKKGSDNPY